MEVRKGEGITLFINPDSNYGLTHYVPIDEEDPMYEYYLLDKKAIENGHYPYGFTKEIAFNYLRCKGCKAGKINNYKRYCMKCQYYCDFEKEYNKIKNESN